MPWMTCFNFLHLITFVLSHFEKHPFFRKVTVIAIHCNPHLTHPATFDQGLQNSSRR